MKSAKIKNILKYIIKLLMSIFIVFYIFVAPVTIFPFLKQSQGYVNKEIEIDYMGILELWNIDTFEGGSVSRTTFLEKRAIEFEKKHTGTFIMVYSMTSEQAKIKIQSGNLPDMVSFGIGAGDMLLPSLEVLNTNYNVREDLINGGNFNGNQMAIPYLLGGYTIINDNNSQYENSIINGVLGCGENSCNNGVLALCVNGMQANLSETNSQLDTFSAYDKYLDKKFDSLLGTQRDMYRVVNRVNKGNMSARSFYNLSGFSDLIQYIGVCKTDQIKQKISKQFIEYLLSDYCQEKIESINMFSVTGKKLYSSGEFSEMETTLQSSLKTVNVFLSKEKLDEIKSLGTMVVNGDKKAMNELKKFLV